MYHTVEPRVQQLLGWLLLCSKNISLTRAFTTGKVTLYTGISNTPPPNLIQGTPSSEALKFKGFQGPF